MRDDVQTSLCGERGERVITTYYDEIGHTTGQESLRRLEEGSIRRIGLDVDER